MPVQLYDTHSRSLQTLESETNQNFRFYCCGPTVYGPAHIGNFRTFLLQDTLRRVLEVDGQPVHHVRNLTDVDDKTINGAIKSGLPLEAFTRQWTEKFHADCAALNCLPPHNEPSAVEHIPQQIALIEQLVKKGHAYATDEGSVYFRVSSFENYGSLSRLKERELKRQVKNSAGERNDADEYEREAVSDFVLWKQRKPEDGENSWKSPWGEGRPGWHLECSAMIESSFEGATLDLHGGGVDLCFPHHENEIAQSECAHGRPLCKHWFHSAHLMVDGAKMSKSLGNLYTLDDLRAKGFSPMALRYALIAGSYRQQLNFTIETLHAAQSALAKLERFATTLLEAAAQKSGDLKAYVQVADPQLTGRFSKAWEALSTNLNTSAALGALFGVVGTNPAPSLSESEARDTLSAFGALLYALGFSLFTEQSAKTETPDAIRSLAEERWEAKQAKDFARADSLRETLLQEGWLVKDSPNGYQIEPNPAP